MCGCVSGGGVVPHLLQYVVSLLSPYIHKRSLFFNLLVPSVCCPAPPEYATKAVGSPVPTHFHNLVYRSRREKGEKAREESCFSLRLLFLSAEMQSLAVPAREEDERRKKMASLHIGTGAYCLFLFSHFIPLSQCFNTKFFIDDIHFNYRLMTWVKAK